MVHTKLKRCLLFTVPHVVTAPMFKGVISFNGAMGTKHLHFSTNQYDSFRPYIFCHKLW